jgi:hypothetical protein
MTPFGPFFVHFPGGTFAYKLFIIMTLVVFTPDRKRPESGGGGWGYPGTLADVMEAMTLPTMDISMGVWVIMMRKILGGGTDAKRS